MTTQKYVEINMDDSFNTTYDADVYANEKAGTDTFGIIALLLWDIGYSSTEEETKIKF